VDDIEAWDQLRQLAPHQTGADALDLYLASPELPDCHDPLTYWLAQKKAGLVLGPLADMAMDYIGCPGVLYMTCAQISLTRLYTAASIDCEHAFSLSGRTVTPWWASLSDESIRSSVLLNSWIQVPGLIAEEEFMETLKNGWKRGSWEESG